MKVILTDRAWKLMHGYVDLCKYEISGLGKVERDEDGNFIVTDVRIFRQKVSGAHSDIEAQALAEFQVEMIQQGENMRDWYLWWHSHASMGVFFSTRDTDTIDESTDFGVLLSVVTNHKHEFKARVDVYEPVRLYTSLEVEILSATDNKTLKLCQKEIDAKVTIPVAKAWERTPTTTPYKYSLYEREEYNPYQSRMGFTPIEDMLPTPKDYSEEWTKEDSEKAIAEMEEYLEEKEALEQELQEAIQAKDNEVKEVAIQMLRDHKRKGLAMGFENNTEPIIGDK